MTIKMELPLTLSSGVNGQLALMISKRPQLQFPWV